MSPAADEPFKFDPFESFGAPVDSLAEADPEHPGVAALHEATQALDAGDASAAVDSCARARARGVPAELVPYLALVDGVARLRCGDASGAAEVLGDAWRTHPDHAALPAALGAARIVAGDATSAAHSMYAALVSDDPDGSLVLHRRRLTLLLGAVRDAR